MCNSKWPTNKNQTKIKQVRGCISAKASTFTLEGRIKIKKWLTELKYRRKIWSVWEGKTEWGYLLYPRAGETDRETEREGWVWVLESFKP
jgi:hypothetical protein